MSDAALVPADVSGSDPFKGQHAVTCGVDRGLVLEPFRPGSVGAFLTLDLANLESPFLFKTNVSIERLDPQSKIRKKSLHSDDLASEGVFNRDR